MKNTGMSTMETKTAHDRHKKLKAMYLEELDRQHHSRQERAKWVRYFNNDQFTAERRKKMEAIGLSPASNNMIRPIIEYLKGTERRGRIDFSISPRTDSKEARESAQAKQELLKWLDYSNQTGFERSMATDQAFITGLGWLEVAARQDKKGPTVISMAEDWRNMLHDSRGNTMDGDDWRYVFRTKVVDLDVAIAIFPGKKNELEKVAQTGSGAHLLGDWSGSSAVIGAAETASSEASTYFVGTDLFSTRDRVMLVEAWTRDPVKRTDKHVGGITDPVSWEINCTIMTSDSILVESKSPYSHGRFPFVPIWCYRDIDSGLPYSPIRDLIDVQDSLNSNLMRAKFLSHVNQFHIEKSAVADMSLEQIELEMRDPMGLAVFADGAISGGRVKKLEHGGDVQKMMLLAQSDMDTMHRMSGITPENRESQSDQLSGKSRALKAEQGALLTTAIFDNLLRARQIEGVMTLAMSEQYMVHQMSVPTEGKGASRKFTTINQWDPKQDRFINDVAAEESEFQVGEQAWKQSHAEAMYDSLMQVLGQLAGSAPQVVVALLDVVFEMHPTLPNKTKVLQRVRQATGMRDEDVEMTPEEQAAQQQQQAVQQAQFDAQMAMLQADIKEAQAKGTKLEAEAMAKRLEALYMAAQGAQVLIQAPQITPAADELLKSAGFVDMGGAGVIDPNVAPPQMQQMAMPVQQEAQPMPELQQADGAMTGIETAAPDGVDPTLSQPGA
jgi:hypothetical protein